MTTNEHVVFRGLGERQFPRVYDGVSESVGTRDVTPDVTIQFNRQKMEQEGLGLGLITALKLIAFYHGTIDFINDQGAGTRVKLSFIKAD